MENQYAQALWQMVEGGMDHNKAVHALHDMLVRDGRTELMHRIGRAFARIASRQLQRKRFTLSVAHEKDQHDARKEATEVLKKLDIRPEEIDTAVDETLVGGWRLEGSEHLVDASFKKHLLTLYNRATQ